MGRHKGKTIPVMHLSGIEVTRLKMPRFNGYLCRGGVHGDTKYVREHAKREASKIINEELDDIN